MNIGIQNSELGQRGGINTYSERLNRYLNKLDDVNSKMFVNKYKNGKLDLICIQYEPGLVPPVPQNDGRVSLQEVLENYKEPVVVTMHHAGYLPQFYPRLDGVVLHAENQVPKTNKPWSYCVIPHPALVYPKKDKQELRKKFGLPLDKKIIGTMGFICGTGKILPITVEKILKRINDDEFLYLITSFWKGGDMGRLSEIMDVVRSLGKEDNFRIDTDFIADDEILNEKMQCCDLLYAWNNLTKDNPGSQSGSASDMYGSRVKLIVKDNPHFSFIGEQEGVLLGRENPEEFADDVLNALRNEDLENTPDPEWLSWENQIGKYISYFKEVAELD